MRFGSTLFAHAILLHTDHFLDPPPTDLEYIGSDLFRIQSDQSKIGRGWRVGRSHNTNLPIVFHYFHHFLERTSRILVLSSVLALLSPLINTEVCGQNHIIKSQKLAAPHRKSTLFVQTSNWLLETFCMDFIINGVIFLGVCIFEWKFKISNC